MANKPKLKFETAVPVIVRLQYGTPKMYDGQYGTSYMYSGTHKDGDNWREVVFYASEGLNGLIQVAQNRTERDLVIEKHTDGTKHWFTVNGKSSDDIARGDGQLDQPPVDIKTPPPTNESQLDRIERKLDAVLGEIGSHVEQAQTPVSEDAIPF
jgi:hypothetical protein